MKSRFKSSLSASRPISWTAGVDWIRHIHDDLQAIPLARERAEFLQWRDEHAGGSVKPWKFQGYEGWASDSIRWGERSGRLLWEASGTMARPTMDRMPLSGGFTSRLDLQVTLKLSTSQRGFGHSLLGSWQEIQNPQSRSRTQRGLAVATNSLWLGTVGRRTSPRFLRIYDKGVEAKCAPPGEIWRVEIECKRHHSRSLTCNHLSDLKRPAWCAQYCVQQLKSLGCSWPYGRFTDESLNVDMLPKEESTAGKLAIWVTHTVRPVIPRLLTVFTVAEVLKMLDLSDVAVPTGRGNAHSNFAKDARARRPRVAGVRSVRDDNSVGLDSAGSVV